MTKMGSRYRSLFTYTLVFIIGAIVASVFWNLNQYIFFRNISCEEDYDYIIYKERGKIAVKNGATGRIDLVGETLQEALNGILRSNAKIFLKNGSYIVTSDILLKDLENVRIISNGALLNFHGNSIVIKGQNYKSSRHNLIDGVVITNGSIRVENSFMITIRNCVFKDCENGIFFINTNGWTECNAVENCYFFNVKKNVVFRTPCYNGTESYANTEIKRCYFELIRENSVAIHVETQADFNEGLIQNVRIWMGSSCNTNQTGILVEGSMLNTLLENVVFESFAKVPLNIYGIRLEKNCAPPIFGQGLVFLGNMTYSVYNPYGKWIYGVGSTFKIESLSIPLGFNDNYGEYREITPPSYLTFSISKLNIKIQAKGNFSLNENIRVRLRFKFIDGAVSKELIKCLNSTEPIWLSYDDLMILWPSANIISSLIVDAKTNIPYSTVNVFVSVYGSYN